MLEIESLSKRYDRLLAVDDISFRVEEGEFVTLLGPSGCGKSTILHTIAGLIEPTDGRIYLRDEDVTDVPPDERNIGMVFQNNALFPHMSVADNVAYGLRMHGADTASVEETIAESLELVHMSGYDDHKPSELSGGQQRRIALARALAYEPDTLLLDEPLTGLDRVLREEMRYEIKRIQRNTGVTTLFVTHDQEEALSMSDRIIALNEGRKEQEGRPESLYERPNNQFVAEFVGKSTKFTGMRDSTDPTLIRNGNQTIHVGNSVEPPTDTELSLYVRPEDITLFTNSKCNGENCFEGTVNHISNVGNRSEIELQLDNGTVVTAEADRFPSIDEGSAVTIGFNPKDVIVL